MSVPLDNLYHWVESLLPDPAVLYVFRPHGSKNISDCEWLNDYDVDTVWKMPAIILHDQEPLDWNFYKHPGQYLAHLKKRKYILPLYNLLFRYFINFNLKSLIISTLSGMYDQVILVHSEKNSPDLEQYQQNEFICVYYWAHAIIARDWYRFAKHDTRLNTVTKPHNKFLIYCRDWSHRREYRLKFLELLVKNNLLQDSQTSVMHTNSKGVHFSQYQFENSAFELHNPELIDCVPLNTFSSSASADYDYIDFVNTQISMVLETVFDGDRIHLTEKTFRPIACGHPFILAAGAGALEYIKSYGFKTFAPWIDESYDLEIDSVQRLEKIIQAMKKIQCLQDRELEDFLHQVKSIAEFNKKHFFSDEFFNQVQDELKNNLSLAHEQVKKSRGRHYLEIIKLSKKYKLVDQMFQRQEKTQFVRQLRRSYLNAPSNPQADQSL